MEKLEYLFARVLCEPVNKIDDKSSPRSLRGWDSMRHVELVLEIERAYHVSFTTAEIVALTSFGRVREMLVKKGALPPT